MNVGHAVASAPATAIPQDPERMVRMIPLEQIRANPRQPRRIFDETKLRELARSIEAAGVMQPIVVRPVRASRGGGGGGMGSGGVADEYELIAGERRWRAAALAGQDAIPALVKDISDELSAEWALIENLQREDLGPMERADAFRALALRFNLTHEQIGARVGLDRSSVTNLVRLTELEPEVRELLETGALGLGHGKALLSLPAGRGRVRVAQQAAKEQWSVRRLEAAAKARPAPAGAGAAAPERPASVTDLERQLGEHLGTKVKIRGGRNWKNGRLTIEFYDLDHFDGLMQKMGFAMRD